MFGDAYRVWGIGGTIDGYVNGVPDGGGGVYLSGHYGITDVFDFGLLVDLGFRYPSLTFHGRLGGEIGFSRIVSVQAAFFCDIGTESNGGFSPGIAFAFPKYEPYQSIGGLWLQLFIGAQLYFLPKQRFPHAFLFRLRITYSRFTIVKRK